MTMKTLYSNTLFPIKRHKQEIIACIPRSLFCTPTVLERSIRIFRFALIVGILMSVPANSKADTVDTDLPFSVVGQSMWSSGPALFSFHETDFIGLEWNESFGVGPTYIFPIGNFGLNASTSGKVGLEYDFTLSSGFVDISYPVTSTIAFPGSAYPGETVSLSSSFVNLDNLNGLDSKMETLSPQATAKLELPLIFAADVDVINPFFPLNIGPSFDGTYEFFNLSTANASFEKDFWGFGSIKANIPVINTEATLSSGKFSASGSDDFITLTLDVDKVLTTSFGLPPLGGEFTYDPLSISCSYDLLDVEASLSAGFMQSFEFTPTLKVKYTLENGYEFVTDVGGAPFDFPIPSGVGDSLDVTAKFFLENQFINDTDLVLTPAIDLSALYGKASLFGYDLIDFGPVFSTGISYPIPINIFDKQFAMAGFESFENNFSIDIVPVPSALILGALGLSTSLTWMRKRRML